MIYGLSIECNLICIPDIYLVKCNSYQFDIMVIITWPIINIWNLTIDRLSIILTMSI